MKMVAGLPVHVAWALTGVFALLVTASAAVWWLNRRSAAPASPELAARVRSWWWIVGIYAVAAVIDDTMSLVVIALVSYLALKEYLSLIPTRRIDRTVLLWAYLAIPVQFYWAGIEWYGMFVVFIPVWMFLFLPLVMALQGETKGYLTAVGTLGWGLMMTVFNLSHMGYLLVSGNAVNPQAGGAGLLFFLLFLTQFNDVAQYCWGKALGRRRITPRVSPNKTWEGFVGGVATTTAVAAMAGPFLTPMDVTWSALSGFIIGVSGFLGDVTISALKRDLGIKDSGTLIPGHGGVLDRVDSLTYSVPVFFHFFHYFFYP
jgi:phosphatidate cytidylyltransferase